MECSKKKEALEQLATGIFRLLTIIAVIMFGIATVGVITTGSDVFSLSALPQWIKFCLIPSLVWFGALLLWLVGCAFYITYITVTEDIKGAIQKLRK
jgi:energy-converting hydrogenase Eha subunit H